MPQPDTVTFQVTCTMRPRWVPFFLGMLRHMQYLGSIGSSRTVTFTADGDGDFRPRFAWDVGLPAPEEPELDRHGCAHFDAG